MRFSDATGQGRWEEIDGQVHWVGDVDGDYDNDLGATWVAAEDNPIGGYWDFGGDKSPVVWWIELNPVPINVFAARESRPVPVHWNLSAKGYAPN